MNSWQRVILLIYGLINLIVFAKGLFESKSRGNAYQLTRHLTPLGIFVWGDAVIFGLFWLGTVITAYFLDDWILFLLVISLFWVVRSLGETIYWFNQQFSTIKRNPPQNLPGYSFFKNDSIWFIHQIGWQCITVISLVFSIYFAAIWLQAKF